MLAWEQSRPSNGHKGAGWPPGAPLSAALPAADQAGGRALYFISRYLRGASYVSGMVLGAGHRAKGHNSFCEGASLREVGWLLNSMSRGLKSSSLTESRGWVLV